MHAYHYSWLINWIGERQKEPNFNVFEAQLMVSQAIHLAMDMPDS